MHLGHAVVVAKMQIIHLFSQLFQAFGVGLIGKERRHNINPAVESRAVDIADDLDQIVRRGQKIAALGIGQMYSSMTACGVMPRRLPSQTTSRSCIEVLT